MRENKFRAWDKFNEDMFFSGESLSQFFKKVERLIKGGNCVEVTQYTGLKDKKRKPIYESDIIKWGGNIETVSYDSDYACFTTETSMLCSVSMEVIGNIYQSPELLEESKQ